MLLTENKLFFRLTVFIFIFILGLTSFLLIKQMTANSKPNLIIISIDALRADHVGIYGYSKDTTPNIDNFAKNSTIFTNFRTVIPMTYPSFATLFNGQHPFKTRITRNQGILLSDRTPTLMKILKENGYKTATFTTGALTPKATNLYNGVDSEDFMFFKTYQIIDEEEIYTQDTYQNYESFLAKANIWLENQTKDSQSNFFLWIHLMDPHAPYQPPEEYKCKFNQRFCDYINSKSPEELENERAAYQFCSLNPLPQEKKDLFETLYDGGVAYSDSLAGKILEKIKELNIDKNTIIVIYSDHGEGFDHNYYFNHRGVLYDSALRIPLLIKTPSSSGLNKSDLMLQNTDFLPTVLELMNIKYDTKNLDGKSFAGQRQPKAKYQYFSNSYLTKYAIFDGRYKYIYSLDNACLLNGQKEELYDLKNDPSELNNLSQKEKGIKDELKDNLLNYLASFNLPHEVKRFNSYSTIQDQKLENLFNPLPY